MLILLGLVLVLGSIVVGYVLEHGQILVLLQPAELIIIGGSAIGIILIANPGRELRKLGRVLRSFRQQSYTPDYYLKILKLLYVLIAYAQRAGVAALEDHVETPDASPIFRQNPILARDKAAMTFLCDSIRTLTTTGMSAEEMDRLMSTDMRVLRSGRQNPVNALTNVADSLPGLGIVAAVLGVVVTMQALGGDPSQVGNKVAAALVGTFLGILLCYGVVGPLATNIQQRNRSRMEVLEVLRTGLLAALRGCPPLIAAEFARRAIPEELRPGYEQMETELRRNTQIPLGDQAERAVHAGA